MRTAVICALLGQLLIPAQAVTTCTYINTISNGWVVYEDNDILNKKGGGIKFFCKKGFTLDGVDKTLCAATGWKDPLPTCKALARCPHITGLNDGTMSDYCAYQGCQPKFVCDAAWKLDGAAAITCTDQGTWDPPPPKCAQNWCDPTETFMNGDVVGYKNPPIVGTQITIKCDDGFELEDANTGSATCQDDLQWSGDFGKCVCKDPSSTACRKAKFNCPRIISIPFGKHQGVGIAPGSWVKVLECMPGYSPPVGGGRASKCRDGVFKGYPKCTYHRCPHIEAIPYGKVTDTVAYGWNDRVSFECNPGYVRDGLGGLQCRQSKNWGPGDGSPPKCVANTCPDIAKFDNGRIKNYQNTVNSYIDFECDPGFTLEGSKRLQCGVKGGESPKWRGGEFPKCVQKIGECTAYGDPHYKTCDGQDINFMGACKMTLSSTCERTTEELKARNLTYFNIEASNFRLVPKALVSYTQFLTVDIYDWRIQLGPGTAVLIGKLGTSPDGIKKMINGIKKDLPVTHLPDAPGFKIETKGRFICLSTNFGLEAKIDEFFKVKIRVPPAYMDMNMCGLCGNFNGDPTDDLVTKEGNPIHSEEVERPDGTIKVKHHYHEIGNSWTVKSEYSKPGCKAYATPDLECESSEMTAAVERNCSILTDRDGVFASCLAVISSADAQDHQENCVYDACSTLTNREELMCNVFTDFGDMCANAGSPVSWRKHDYCPLPCGINQKYTPKMPKCIASCSDPNPSGPECSGAIVADDSDEGCECEKGFLMSNDKCVPKEDCGCVDPVGNYVEKGESYVNKDCTQAIMCVGAGKFVKKDRPPCHRLASCSIKEGERRCFCQPGYVGDGVTECKRKAPDKIVKGMCIAAGDPMFTSYDNVKMEYHGTCDYLLTAPCSNDEWAVITRHIATYRDGGKRAFVHHILVQLGSHEYKLEEFGKAQVDGIELNLPAILSDGEVKVEKIGPQVVLTTAFGLKIEYDGRGPNGRHRANITVTDGDLMGKLCGICGNWNDQAHDDLFPKNSNQQATHFEIGKSWRVGGVTGCED